MMEQVRNLDMNFILLAISEYEQGLTFLYIQYLILVVPCYSLKYHVNTINMVLVQYHGIAISYVRVSYTKNQFIDLLTSY